MKQINDIVAEQIYKNLTISEALTFSEIDPIKIPNKLMGSILIAKIIVIKNAMPTSSKMNKLSARNSMALAIPVIQPADQRILNFLFLKHSMIISF